MNNLTIDIYGKCNQDCEFCYQDLDGSMLSTEQVLKIVDESKYSETVNIGGGEPFLHSGILDIINGIRERDRKVHIATDAAIIPKGLLELEDRVREGATMQVSLHASNPELFKRITNRNLFDAVIRNTRRLTERYQTLISTAVYQVNYDDVPNIVDLVVKELEIPIRVNLVFPEGKGKDVELLRQDQIDRLIGYLLLQRIKTNGLVDSPLVHENNCTALESAYGIEKKGLCPVDCGIKIYVSPRGTTHNCEFLVSGEKNAN